MRGRSFAIALAAIVVAGVLVVASTHRTFSAVVDEPVHIAAGYDLIRGERYLLDGSHPPLERLLSALPLRFEPIAAPTDPERVGRGNQILYGGHGYRHNLARARRGNLVLLALAIVGTALWARRFFGDAVALMSAGLVLTLPPILAHAGLATTDLAVAATLPLALYALDLWLERPTVGRGALLGVFCGLGLLSKFSFIVFFPVSVLVVIACRRPRTLSARSLVTVAGVALFLVWAGYFFEFARISATPGAERYVVEPMPRAVQRLASWVSRNVPVPAPIFWVGIGSVQLHNRYGHPAFLLGRYSDRGWWYYFPVVLFFKTPIPFLILAVWGAVSIARDREWRGLQFAIVPLAMLGAAMTSSINIGVRHVLPVYPPLAILCAVALHRGRRSRAPAAVQAALVAWLLVGTIRAHPDHLAWFNEFAGRHPERIAIDSNLDWGQDLLRLAGVARELHIDTLHTAVVGSARLDVHGVNAEVLQPYSIVAGWVAVSETALGYGGRNGEYDWLDRERPVRRVGKSIRLYHVGTIQSTDAITCRNPSRHSCRRSDS